MNRYRYLKAIEIDLNRFGSTWSASRFSHGRFNRFENRFSFGRFNRNRRFDASCIQKLHYNHHIKAK
jgi:hypothetical protein